MASIAVSLKGVHAQQQEDIARVDLSERPQCLIRRHPWEVARYHFFSRIIETWGISIRPSSVLDVGSGDGFFSQQLVYMLAEGSRIVCWDIHYTDADMQVLTRQSPNSIRYEAAEPDQRFDLVVLLDVLEHVDEDVMFLKRIVDQHMMPGGMAIISVPAWPALLSSHDLALKHCRRYSRRDGFRLVRESGLKPLASGGLFYSLLLPRIVAKVRERQMNARTRRWYSVDRWAAGAFLTRVVLYILNLDCLVSKLLSRAGLGFPGLSWWAVCRKP